MGQSRPPARHPGRRHYRLVVDEGLRAQWRSIEFEADGPQSALLAADRLGAGQEVAIFEDGRPLARVRMVEGAGCWVINPPLLAPGPPGGGPLQVG